MPDRLESLHVQMQIEIPSNDWNFREHLKTLER